MKFKKACKKQIKEIMEEFDFENVQKIMTTLNWTWAHVPPDINEIKFKAERLLRDACKQLKRTMKISYEQYIATSIGSGGFTVEGDVSLSDDIECPFVRLKLYFGLSSYNDGINFNLSSEWK